MIFAPPNKGFFVELGDHAVLLARTSAPVPPFTVEELHECAPGDAAAVREVIAQLQPKKSPSGYLQANVGVYPAKRLVRRHSLELKRVKEPEYFPEVFTQQFRIEPDKYTLAILNSDDGTEYDAAKMAQKEVLFCGLPTEDIASTQTALLDLGVYPERLEIATVSVLGAMVEGARLATKVLWR